MNDASINAMLDEFFPLENYDFGALAFVEKELETKKDWTKEIMKVPRCDWTKYNFEKAYKYLQDNGLRGGVPSLKSEWMKMLVNTQIYGGIGTIDDMLSYVGWSAEKVPPWRKYALVNFLQYYYIIEEVKRQRKGGRIFEITKFGEDLIDWAAQH